jgi:hypothetical protein
MMAAHSDDGPTDGGTPAWAGWICWQVCVGMSGGGLAGGERCEQR